MKYAIIGSSKIGTAHARAFVQNNMYLPFAKSECSSQIHLLIVVLMLR
jgi:predicted dinucleotide-binding enzyme